MLIDDIRADLVVAMKAKDEVTKRTLRSVIAAVQEAQVSGSSATALDDGGVLKVIGAQVKRRIEAEDAFASGNRPEKAADERAEIEVLERYLPAALSAGDLDALIGRVLAEGGWSSKADMGAAMKAVNVEVGGRADGRTVADLVKARLN